MKINTKQTLKTLANKDIQMDDKPFTVGLAMSSILLESKEGGKHKMYILSQKFFSEDEVDVDSADLAIIKNSVEKSDIYNNLIYGQILEILSKE